MEETCVTQQRSSVNCPRKESGPQTGHEASGWAWGQSPDSPQAGRSDGSAPGGSTSESPLVPALEMNEITVGFAGVKLEDVSFDSI